jgi:mRNA interferase RelE/StbE
LKRYRVLVSETVLGQLRRMADKEQRRVKEALSELEIDPFRPRPKADVKRSRGPKGDLYRQRVGGLRIIFVVEGDEVKVVKILPRSKASSWLD